MGRSPIKVIDFGDYPLSEVYACGSRHVQHVDRHIADQRALHQSHVFEIKYVVHNKKAPNVIESNRALAKDAPKATSAI